MIQAFNKVSLNHYFIKIQYQVFSNISLYVKLVRYTLLFLFRRTISILYTVTQSGCYTWLISDFSRGQLNIISIHKSHRWTGCNIDATFNMSSHLYHPFCAILSDILQSNSDSLEIVSFTIRPLICRHICDVELTIIFFLICSYYSLTNVQN